MSTSWRTADARAPLDTSGLNTGGRSLRPAYARARGRVRSSFEGGGQQGCRSGMAVNNDPTVGPLLSWMLWYRYHGAKFCQRPLLVR